ncbi:hypothetical protein NDU88_010813 [Pleurodeles waltl]|uniref:Uncharacterized protein n=1 Tax=Pleurodeles waltl TaxID=8319 RepID=A0AAV7S3N2_PLEWA|nr:hypothetical protein NDU88_010813 [Pleurodeles waltl]
MIESSLTIMGSKCGGDSEHLLRWGQRLIDVLEQASSRRTGVGRAYWALLRGVRTPALCVGLSGVCTGRQIRTRGWPGRARIVWSPEPGGQLLRGGVHTGEGCVRPSCGAGKLARRCRAGAGLAGGPLRPELYQLRGETDLLGDLRAGGHVLRIGVSVGYRPDPDPGSVRD